MHCTSSDIAVYSTFPPYSQNIHSFAITAHLCQGAPGNWSSCDCHTGCQINAYAWDETHLSYGPGVNFTINTLMPFNVTLRFPVDADTGFLTAIENIWSQDGRSFTARLTEEYCDETRPSFGPYLEQFTAQLAGGMTLVSSYWGNQGMDWLDSEPNGPCDPEAICTDPSGNLPATVAVSGIRLAALES